MTYTISPGKQSHDRQDTPSRSVVDTCSCRKLECLETNYLYGNMKLKASLFNEYFDGLRVLNTKQKNVSPTAIAIL